MPGGTKDATQSAMRKHAREIFDYALAECSIPRAFARYVSFSDSILNIADRTYDVSDYSSVVVVSLGKAGHSMAHALADLAPVPFTGVVSCPVPTSAPVAGLRYFCGGHPMPNEDSLRAGDAILQLLRGLPPRSLVLFLISGGASAIAEKSFYPQLALADVIQTYRTLVHSGAPIAEINAIRKHLSALKGGRAAQAATGATQVSLLVSDVPDHSLDALASGPTMPDSSTIADCYAIARRYDMLPRFPEPAREIFEAKRLQETPKPGDPAFARSQFQTVLSNQTATAAAAEKAKGLGFTVEMDNSCDDWDYQRAADYLLDRLHELRQNAPKVCLISGGEVTVKVGAESGVGGRNQQFALYCATKTAGDSITVLSAGTDGVDGNSNAAGAIIDGGTVARVLKLGTDPSAALQRFDANPLLHSIGDEIVTGPTGNNVRDLRVLLAY
jgi:hydroxypyruvate reductase